MSMVRFFNIENYSFFYFDLNVNFVSFWFQYFFAVNDPNGAYFAFAHGDARVQQNVSFDIETK
jgi:hypothetical protein